MATEIQLFKEPGVVPDDSTLKVSLGEELFMVYSEIMKSISLLGFICQWNYYKDGKAWLCKVVFRKKTVFWLSAWKQYLKVGFYFMEKDVESLLSLDIDIALKESFAAGKPIGRLIPLVIDIHSNEQIDDLIKVALYKVKK